MIFDLILLALLAMVYFATGRQLERNQRAMIDLKAEITGLEYQFRAYRAKHEGDA